MQSNSRGWRVLLLLAVAGLIAACNATPQETQTSESGMVRGRARVVSVNEALGIATLEIEGKMVQAYWERERFTAQGGAIVRQGPLKPTTGDYREPLVQTQGFPAQPGDTIYFVAMKTGRDLFLRGAQVVEK